MSKKAIEEISSELELFRNKLSTLQTTVNYLQNAKEIAGSAIETIEKTNQNFNTRIVELKHAYFKVVEYEKTIDELVLKIKNVNFPERLDKIETSLNQALGDLGATKDVFVDELLKVTTEIHAVVGKIDEFIINYQGILDEQINGLKNEIEGLRKFLQELDFKGTLNSAKTEIAQIISVKVENLAEKLGTLGVSLQGLAGQCESTHNLCAKNFPALLVKIEQEAEKANHDYLEPIKADTKGIVNSLAALNDEVEYIKNESGITHQLSKVILNNVDEIKTNQQSNHKLVENIKQQITALELRNDHISTKIDVSQKAQRLQFMILMAVVIVFGIVLLLK
jgi:prefoldin subunit 5